MAALFPPTEEALWGLAGPTPGVTAATRWHARGRQRAAAGQRGKDSDEGRKDTREKPRGRSPSSCRRVALKRGRWRARLRGPHTSTLRCRAEANACVTSVTAAGRKTGKKKKPHTFLWFRLSRKKKKKQARLKSECVEFHVRAKTGAAEVFFFSGAPKKSMCARKGRVHFNLYPFIPH